MHGTGVNPAVGRITGTSVGELRFRIGPDEPVHLGEILIAEPDAAHPQMAQMPMGASSSPSSVKSVDSRPAQPPFYLRVTDLQYGADARDGDWEERTAGALMSDAGEDLILYDREQRLFKSAVAEPLGYLQADG